MNDSSRPFVALLRLRAAWGHGGPDLDALRGPRQGRFRLPLHLDASARALYDFASASDRELAYRLVLLEAGSPTDHEHWLDRDELLRQWSDLYLPRSVRAAW